MTGVVVTGYASLDYAVRLDGPAEADRTTRIVGRNAWPRLGGSPAHVSLALVRAGIADVVPVSWVAADGDGDRYVGLLKEHGVSAEGVDRHAGRTPICILAYQPDGGCVCLYDAGLDAEPDLSPAQTALVASAGWVCLTVGPPAVSRAVLAAIRPDARLAWAVKADPKAVTPELAVAIAARADVISFSRRERPFLDPALAAASRRPRRILVETRGAGGVAVAWSGQSAEMAAAPVPAADPTGAGDTFVGGLIAALVGDPRDPPGAVRAGMAAARNLLLSRQ